MFAEVVPRRRDGLITPRWQFGPLLRRGILEVREGRCQEANRTLRVATLMLGDQHLLLPLRDVKLLAIRDSVLSISGFEVNGGVVSGYSYHQNWLVRMLESSEWSTWLASEERLPQKDRQQAIPSYRLRVELRDASDAT